MPLTAQFSALGARSSAFHSILHWVLQIVWLGPQRRLLGRTRASLKPAASGALTPLGAGSVLLSGFTFTASSLCFVFFPDSGQFFLIFLKRTFLLFSHIFPLSSPYRFPNTPGGFRGANRPIRNHPRWPASRVPLWEPPVRSRRPALLCLSGTGLLLGSGGSGQNSSVSGTSL